MISVIVTVGPHPDYKKYLEECLQSIKDQDSVGEIVLVDDAAHLKKFTGTGMGYYKEYGSWINYIKNPWNLGQAASLNIGIAKASNELIFVMGGSDDILLKGCIRECVEEYRRQRTTWALYSPMIITSEGETSNLPQGVWLFHKSVWIGLGGYPKDAISEVDAMFASVALKQGVVMHPVGTEPLYWHREWRGALGQTKSMLRHDISGLLRSLVTTEWEHPYWAKGYGYDV